MQVIKYSLYCQEVKAAFYLLQKVSTTQLFLPSSGIEVMLEVKLTFEGHMAMLHSQKAELWEEPALLILLTDASC